MTKLKRGRPTTIISEFPLERITTRISKEAISILDEQDNKAAFIDAAIKEKGNRPHFLKVLEDEFPFDPELNKGL